jgi:hypothetical protein
MSPRTCRWQSAHAPACRGSCVVARTVCHQHPARNRGPLFEAAPRQQRCCRSAWRRPARCRDPEVDEILEFVTGQTLKMTGADLVLLALPSGGHRQLTIRHAAGNGAGRRQLPSVSPPGPSPAETCPTSQTMGATASAVVRSEREARLVAGCQLTHVRARPTGRATVGSAGNRAVNHW